MGTFIFEICGFDDFLKKYNFFRNFFYQMRFCFLCKKQTIHKYHLKVHTIISLYVAK